MGLRPGSQSSSGRPTWSGGKVVVPRGGFGTCRGMAFARVPLGLAAVLYGLGPAGPLPPQTRRPRSTGLAARGIRHGSTHASRFFAIPWLPRFATNRTALLGVLTLRPPVKGTSAGHLVTGVGRGDDH